MVLFAVFIVCLMVVVRVCTLPVGSIDNASFATPNTSMILINATDCNGCLCAMFTAPIYSSILSLNCISRAAGSVVCELLNSTISPGSTSAQMRVDPKSIFFFRILSTTTQPARPLTTGITTRSAGENGTVGSFSH